jgi:hypothetical protein
VVRTGSLTTSSGEVVVVDKGRDSPEWYVRSLSDYDTHRGWYCTSIGRVHAVCGVEFAPLPVGWSGDRLALTGQPPDPEQVCPDCYRADIRNSGGPEPR